jgi:hypothetical protein
LLHWSRRQLEYRGLTIALGRLGKKRVAMLKISKRIQTRLMS